MSGRSAVHRVVVIGGGIAGLASALFHARASRQVVLVERDPPSEVDGGDDAFERWSRPSVPQWRFAHNFHSRSRCLLAERAPDVLDRLRADGITEVNWFRRIFPPETWMPSDEEFTSLQSRRPAFELALRRAVEADERVRIVSPAVVDGLVFDCKQPARARGVRLGDGTRLAADVVLDAGGRRSSVTRWLRDAGIEVPVQSQSCELTYYSRYFRRRPGAAFDHEAHVRADTGHLVYWTFVGDHNTYGIVFGAPPWDDVLKVLRHGWAWDALARSIPELAPRVDPEHGEPLHDVQVMAGHRSVLRDFAPGGLPLVHGLLSVGDAICTTNPAFGWGASMALTHAAAACDAVDAQPGEPAKVAESYYDAVREESESVYRSSAAIDRVRTQRWQRVAMSEADVREADRLALVEEGVIPLALTDPDAGRSLLRRIGLLSRPDAIFEDAELMDRARAEQVRRSSRPARRTPTRDETLAVIASARA